MPDISKCHCSGPGHCPLYGRTVNQREWELCSCTIAIPALTSPTQCLRRRARWLAQATGQDIGTAGITIKGGGPTSPVTRVEPTPPPPPGPGTELKALLKEMGIFANSSCGCNAKANDMDLWGVEGCKQHKEEIVQWLRDAQKRAGWVKTFTATLSSIKAGLWLNPMSPLESLVDEAIRRAEEKYPGAT